MSLFGNFENPLKSNVGNNHTNDPDDIVKTKRHLNKLGYFAEDTEVPFITKAMENGIIKYQKDNNLKIDGVMKPSGETERTIFSDLESVPYETVWERDVRFDKEKIGFGGSVRGYLAKNVSEYKLREPYKTYYSQSDKIEVEELPPPKIYTPNIPGTNIPDEGIGEGERPKRVRKSTGDKKLEKKPPLVDPRMRIITPNPFGVKPYPEYDV
ncbi:MAG: peptidoglycan-binding domain-containing protein [Pseudomonadota bacterium]|nr:peptidoglycan-binding domain-containing protein [Pseudomonadota bacterium]MEC7702371.1 peptidoglycan-binding domain-containing protein [Pseudomonadota bacterium]